MSVAINTFCLNRPLWVRKKWNEYNISMGANSWQFEKGSLNSRNEWVRQLIHSVLTMGANTNDGCIDGQKEIE